MRHILLSLLLPMMANATPTDVLTLNGTWDFHCSGGMHSGRWGKIQVPSQWEQQGYGNYTYGRYYIWDKEAKPSDETGIYRRQVNIPSEWKGKKIRIVFDGVMTDTEVTVDGQAAGPTHRGGFYSFAYDITDKVTPGKKADIEVKVAKQSADLSVNAAERRADWWLFGGIYRDVRLEAVPETHIERLQLDPKADGTLRAMAHTAGADGCKVRISVAGQSFTSDVEGQQTLLSHVFTGMKTWDPEHPNLYTLRAELLGPDGATIHEVSEKIGFRTVEFRPSDGIYLNGTKLLLKGVNRHCFTPELGRTPSPEQNREDARLIKQMNMNAVRSHYSPDRDFLNVCDSVGLLYFDEFCGWHGRYDYEVGLKLLQEQMASDQNHACVFMWGNGNEGGWNRRLDAEFALLDLQKRHVAHPWQDFNGIDTHHYPAYYDGPGKFSNGDRVFMPTEFLHSQYDKGGGAGLEDYWAHYSSSPLCAGGFIWSFADEAVARTDMGGKLDSDGPNAPDGIVGPHREKEGSFFAIRDIWSPIQIAPLRITPSFEGDIFVANRFLFSTLDECRMEATVGKSKIDVPLRATLPGETAKVRIPLPDNWADGDILRLDAFTSTGDTINSWTWPIHQPRYYYDMLTADGAPASYGENYLMANGVKVTFADGVIESAVAGEKTAPLSGGPLPVGLSATFEKGRFRMEGDDAVYTVKYKGDIDSIQWRMRPDGTLKMEAVMLNRKKPEKATTSLLGLTFTCPEEEIKGMTWKGLGPYRVWRNRQRGQLLGVWHKDYNNTVTGESYEELIYPEFKGYHGNLYWADIETTSGSFKVHTATENLFLQMLRPEEPERRRDGKATLPKFPDADISFLYEIPAAESFRSVRDHGPISHDARIRLNSGDYGLHLSLLFDFRQSE